MPQGQRRGRNNERMRIEVVGTIVVPSSKSGFMARTDPPTNGAERPKDTSTASTLSMS
jgi:hypothetical protein